MQALLVSGLGCAAFSTFAIVVRMAGGWRGQERSLASPASPAGCARLGGRSRVRAAWPACDACSQRFPHAPQAPQKYHDTFGAKASAGAVAKAQPYSEGMTRWMGHALL